MIQWLTMKEPLTCCIALLHVTLNVRKVFKNQMLWKQSREMGHHSRSHDLLNHPFAVTSLGAVFTATTEEAFSLQKEQNQQFLTQI